MDVEHEQSAEKKRKFKALTHCTVLGCCRSRITVGKELWEYLLCFNKLGCSMSYNVRSLAIADTLVLTLPVPNIGQMQIVHLVL